MVRYRNLCERWGKDGRILLWVVREQLNEKVTFEQRPEGGKGMNHKDIWRKRP